MLLEPNPSDPDKWVQGLRTSGIGLIPAYCVSRIAKSKSPEPTAYEYDILENLSREFIKAAALGKYEVSFHISEFGIQDDEVLRYLRWLNGDGKSASDYRAMFDPETKRMIVNWS